MKQDNAAKQNHVKWFAVLGIAMTVLVGVIFAASGLSGGKLLSQFSGNSVTPATASTMWQPSVGNPNRVKVVEYSTRLDGIIVRILARGSTLTASGFKSYIANLADGILAIGAKPEYADDQDIKNVVAYLTYELNDAKTSLSMGGAFFSDITNLVEGTGGGEGTINSVSTTGSIGVEVNSGNQSNNTNSACPNGDIQIGNQTWAGCNSILGNGSDYTGTAGSTDLGISAIAGKYYTWDNQNSACPAGWKVPSRDDFKTLFATLGCTAYNPGYATSVICPGLGWTGGGNTLAKALKIPLAGYKDTRFSPDSLHRGSVVYLATSTLYEDNTSMRRSIIIDKNSDKLDEYASPKATEYSVRCLKVTSAVSTTNTSSVNQTSTTTTQSTNTTSTTQATTTTQGTNTTSAFQGCTRNGTSYIHGDVRCDGNQQVRCNNGSFVQISSCGAGNMCVENPERTSNNNFFTSCVREYDTYRKGAGTNYITISETELATLKDNAEYKCKYNTSAKNYGNCVYQSCISGQSHEEGGICVPNARECTLNNSTNGGRQTWISGSGWSTCQVTSSTACSTGYRLVNGVCATGAATCNSSTISYGQDITVANGVEISNKTFEGYAGSGDNNWQYDTSLSKACTWKCKEGYKKTSTISGYRGNELCAVPDPVIKISASKTTANPGDTVTISWSVSDFYDDGYIKNTLGENVAGCYFREPAELSNWVAGVGEKNPRGIVGSVDYTVTKETVFRLNCRGSIRNAGSTESITVKMSPPPTVNLGISFGGGTGGDFFQLNWSNQNALSCTVGGPGATILGWTAAGSASNTGYQQQRFPAASIIDRLPGKKVTLTCTGLGGTTTAEAEYSKNSTSGSCVNGKFYKNGSIYPDPNEAFTTWLRAEYTKFGRLSLDVTTITKWTEEWKKKVLAGTYDSTAKSDISKLIQAELSGDWNRCSE